MLRHQPYRRRPDQSSREALTMMAVGQVRTYWHAGTHTCPSVVTVGRRRENTLTGPGGHWEAVETGSQYSEQSFSIPGTGTLI